ncbi:MAG: site-2 protease family protein [Firmicutes bacterium]|nr:site-2 protease family protein [Bacillota bacterium]
MVPAILFAVSVHEFSHGMMAYRLGDPTAKYQGRLTLNPLAHLDPLGALMLVLFRFGWAKPVMVNPLYFKDRRRGMMMVGLAGPLANVISAWVFRILLRILPSLFSLRIGLVLHQFILLNIAINLGLAAFNLIPIPPLDGSKIVAGLLPARYETRFQRLETYGPVVLLVLLFTGLASRLMSPIVSFLGRLISIFPRF